jgi:uracil-DNA glycosylase family 4
MSKNDTWKLLEEQIISCQKCPRLVGWREHIANTRRKAFRDWNYWGKPVPGFGDKNARILVIGLAPGAHGSNRTGRMFTGDASGEFLFKHLFNAGFANQPFVTSRNDGLVLHDIFISAICRCAPPGNKPTTQEKNNCLPYLKQEISLLRDIKIVVVLGKMAYDVLSSLYDIDTIPAFKHAEAVKLGEYLPWAIFSYHPSRQNTQTGRLTPDMFAKIWSMVNQLLQKE